MTLFWASVPYIIITSVFKKEKKKKVIVFLFGYRTACRFLSRKRHHTNATEI